VKHVWEHATKVVDVYVEQRGVREEASSGGRNPAMLLSLRSTSTSATMHRSDGSGAQKTQWVGTVY
jgi:hypothetical protein